MNKAEFIEKLSALLAAQPENERARLIAYATEMIDDRMEAGMSEADAVAALGDPEGLARECLDALGAAEAASAPRPDPSACYVDALREVRVHMKIADAVIRREALSNGAAAQLQFSDPEAFEYSTQDGVLEITEKPQQKRGLFGIDGLDFIINGLGQNGRRFTLTLAGPILEQLIFDSHGGDLQISDIQTRTQMVLSNSSGDIEARGCACGGRMEINLRSGDVIVEDTQTRGDMKIEALSGDVTLRRAEAQHLRVRTSSGDLKIEHSRSEALQISVSSGDVEIHAPEAGLIACESTSGDISLTNPNAAQIELRCTSGDIAARLPNRPGGYELNAHTLCGDISLPKHWTPAPGDGEKARFNANTTSGDIRVTIEGARG